MDDCLVRSATLERHLLDEPLQQFDHYQLRVLCKTSSLSKLSATLERQLLDLVEVCQIFRRRQLHANSSSSAWS